MLTPITDLDALRHHAYGLAHPGRARPRPGPPRRHRPHRPATAPAPVSPHHRFRRRPHRGGRRHRLVISRRRRASQSRSRRWAPRPPRAVDPTPGPASTRRPRPTDPTRRSSSTRRSPRSSPSGSLRGSRAAAPGARGHPDDTPSEIQLWPEHFDLALDLGPESGRANFGASPGDGGHALPYLYVGPWNPNDDPFWNAGTYARLGYEELSADRRSRRRWPPTSSPRATPPLTLDSRDCHLFRVARMTSAAVADDGPVDRRRLRTERGRQLVVDALLAYYDEGDHAAGRRQDRGPRRRFGTLGVPLLRRPRLVGRRRDRVARSAASRRLRGTRRDRHLRRAHPPRSSRNARGSTTRRRLPLAPPLRFAAQSPSDRRRAHVPARAPARAARHVVRAGARTAFAPASGPSARRARCGHEPRDDRPAPPRRRPLVPPAPK